MHAKNINEAIALALLDAMLEGGAKSGMTLGISPAYGALYNTDKDVVEAWHSGKDFKIYGGPYLSNRNTQHLIADGYVKVLIRYRAWATEREWRTVEIELASSVPSEGNPIDKLV